MDKDKALERLNILETEAKEFHKIIEAPDPAPSLLTKPVPGSGDQYWIVTEGGSYCQLSNAERNAFATHADYYTHGNLFQSEELAKAYAEAFDTMLLLRHQPGTVAPKISGSQWIIKTSNEQMISLFVDGWCRWPTKSQSISPCFVTKKDAQRAIETVGEERIIRMFKTLHHVE